MVEASAQDRLDGIDVSFDYSDDEEENMAQAESTRYNQIKEKMNIISKN